MLGLATLAAGVAGWLATGTFMFLPAFLLGYCMFFGGHETLWLLYHTGWRDLTTGLLLLKIKRRIARAKNSNQTIVQLFEETAGKFPDRNLFYFEGNTWTFREVSEQTDAVAAFFQQKGYKKGDCVALLMENSPLLVIYWLGLAKIGVVSALINFNLREEPLLHSITVCSADAVLCSASLLRLALQPVRDRLPVPDDAIFTHGSTDTHYQNVEEKLVEMKSAQVERASVGCDDTVIYIFTSGTTGMPKAAKINSTKYIAVLASFTLVMRVTEKDVVWSPLPLYHSQGGVLGLGLCLANGACLAMRGKFSASNFWTDVDRANATIFVYLGEICKYLFAQPPRDTDKKHKIRFMVGAGLKKDMWIPFTQRFGIPNVMEVYGSTEGNCNIANVTQKPGAVGFVSRLLPSILPITLIKVDPEGNLVRDSGGVCVKAMVGEPGHVLGRIIPGDALRRFDGYVGESETKKKIVSDVFKKGDRAFLSGDILVMDREGYLYFRDRTGDTFRWKGENVSTTEVEAVITPVVNQQDVIVYGVEVPGNDGKAGMAAILDEKREVDLELLAQTIVKKLPTYARPIFLRLLSSTSQHLTGTFKLKKVELVKEGYDLFRVTDPLFFFDAATATFRPLDQQLYDSIQQCQLRL